MNKVILSFYITIDLYNIEHFLTYAKNLGPIRTKQHYLDEVCISHNKNSQISQNYERFLLRHRKTLGFLHSFFFS